MKIGAPAHCIDALLIDPSLFTAPYDAALSEGLRANGVAPRWATRKLRPAEEPLLEASETWPVFYPLTDGPNRRTSPAWRIAKGAEHILGMRRASNYVSRRHADIVHIQWGVLPGIDAWFVRRMKRHCPVVITVHDSTPFNGKKVSKLQQDGFGNLLRACDCLIVHTSGAEAALRALPGLPPISVIPHGLLASRSQETLIRGDSRWCIVMFGKIQDYKGADILIEAAGKLSSQDRDGLRIVIAGEALVPIDALRARVDQLGLGDCLEIREGHLSEKQVANLLDEADCFVFPYRAIEASGVLFLVADRGKWLIASNLGAFRETIGADMAAGELVAPNDPAALAAALAGSVGRRPSRSVSAEVPSWIEIGRRTRVIYEHCLAAFQETAG